MSVKALCKALKLLEKRLKALTERMQYCPVLRQERLLQSALKETKAFKVIFWEFIRAVRAQAMPAVL